MASSDKGEFEATHGVAQATMEEGAVNFPDCPHQTTGRNPIPARRKPRRNVARREKEWPDEKAREAANTFLAFRYRHSNKSISFRPTPLISPFFSVLYKFCDLPKRGEKPAQTDGLSGKALRGIQRP